MGFSVIIRGKLAIWFLKRMVMYVYKKFYPKEYINPQNNATMKKVLNKKTVGWSAVVALLIPALIKILEWLNEYLLTMP